MASFEKDDESILSDTNDRQLLDEHDDHSRLNRLASRTRNASISIHMESCESGTDLVGHTVSSSDISSLCKNKYHKALYGDAQGWARRCFCFLQQYIPGVMNPHTKVVQQWNKFFVISCLVAIFVDPLFFFLLSVQKDNKCIAINMPLTITIMTLRSMTDLIYFLHMLLQFRLAYVDPGTGELIKHPKQIARNYLSGYFAMDLFLLLSLSQIIISLILRLHLGFSKVFNNVSKTVVLVQYLPRIYRFLSLLAVRSPTGILFEGVWTDFGVNFVVNLVIIVLSCHVVGSCWYLFGLQRVNRCLQDACRASLIKSCMEFIDCRHSYDSRKLQFDEWESWKINSNANACLSEDGFPYGIYKLAVHLTTTDSIIIKYTYSLFWGFQQISTLAGNQVPSDFFLEVLFAIVIIGQGLLVFTLLIGNMQNFLQALGKRRLDMSLRRRDVDQWMSHRRLPKELRRKVREAERYNFSATRGVNEEMLLENLPKDLQRDIRRHLFNFMKKVWIFAHVDDPAFDAICERVRPKVYIKDSIILDLGDLVEKMVFIVRGKTESIGENGIVVPLSDGDVCGEELLPWCLEHFTVNKDGKNIRSPEQRLLSDKTVTCMTNVEAFLLRAEDLQEVTSHFSRFFRSPRIQQAIRYESQYWRSLAAIRIQIAWRYKRKRLNRANTSKLNRAHSGSTTAPPTFVPRTEVSEETKITFQTMFSKMDTLKVNCADTSQLNPTSAHSGSTSASPPSFVPQAGFSEETNIIFQTMFSKIDTLQTTVMQTRESQDAMFSEMDTLQTTVMQTRERQDAMFSQMDTLQTTVMQTRERQDAMMQAANQSVTRLVSAIQELANIMRTR